MSPKNVALFAYSASTAANFSGFDRFTRTRNAAKMSEHTTTSYFPAEVERKWQNRWDEGGTNRFTGEELRRLGREGKPFYNLMMFPYPSAEGLHVGNMFAFTGSDLYGRFTD